MSARGTPAGFAPGSVVVVSGIMGAGKSTVAELLAQRLPRGAHVRGDTFRRAIVSGRVEMTPDAGADALDQLRLRYRIAAMVADEYAAAGFTAVLQDIMLGAELGTTVGRLRARSRYVIVLAPRPEVALRRAESRSKPSGYGEWTADALDGLLRATPTIGLWLDTSEQSPAETLEEILARVPDALVSDPVAGG